MKNKKIFGVVEGFYGRYYSFYERCDLVDFLARLKLNTYVYGPKSDPYHRKEYHRLYPAKILKEFESINKLAKKHKIDFNYALSPGAEPNNTRIIKKTRSMMNTGISNFSLFYDDIKLELNAKNAIIQAETANYAFEMLKMSFSDFSLFFCPTQYRGCEKTDYILTLVEQLHPDIKIFWTGKSVVSKCITEQDVANITRLIGRQPLIWDNIFANDYIPGIILKFPYRNREPGIIRRVSGILLNPMNQYLQSKPLIYTASKFFNNPYNYNPKKSWKTANHYCTNKQTPL